MSLTHNQFLTDLNMKNLNCHLLKFNLFNLHYNWVKQKPCKTSTKETTKQNIQKRHSVLIIPNVTPAALAMAIRYCLIDAKTL